MLPRPCRFPYRQDGPVPRIALLSPGTPMTSSNHRTPSGAPIRDVSRPLGGSSALTPSRAWTGVQRSDTCTGAVGPAATQPPTSQPRHAPHGACSGASSPAARCGVPSTGFVSGLGQAHPLPGISWSNQISNPARGLVRALAPCPPAARETPDPSESALGEAAATSQRTHSNSPLRQITDPVAPETAVRQHSESLHPETTRSTTLSPSTSPHEHTSPPKNSSSVVDCSFQITLPVRHEIANTCPNLISFSRFICLEMSLNGTPVIDLMYIGYPGAVTRRSPIPSPSRSPVADREIERTHSWQIILRSRCQGRAPGTHGAHLPVRLAAGPAPRCFSHSAAAPRATTRARTRPAA